MTVLARVFREEREVYLLGLVRMAIGAMLLRHVVRLATELSRQGYFAERFFIPIVPPTWVPSSRVYALWLAAMALGAVCAVLGVRAREGLLFGALSGLYLLLCDRLQYHNNRYALLLLALLLAFAPCDRAFVVARGQPKLGPRWAATLMQMQVSLIYFTSAGSKLLDPDWRGGRVLLLRAMNGLALAPAHGVSVPAFAIALANSALCMSIVSKLAIATELFLAVGLWRPRLRAVALWIGLLFHLGIELGARVELFSYVMWTSYLLFAKPELRERTLSYRAELPAARWLARGVRSFDWLARFRVEPCAPHIAQRSAFRVCDRDGQWSSGVRAVAGLARALPVLFPLWLPLAATCAWIDASSARE